MLTVLLVHHGCINTIIYMFSLQRVIIKTLDLPIMELVNEEVIKSVIKYLDPKFEAVKWYFEEFQDKLIGYLGDYIKLIIEVGKLEVREKLRFFVKCMPRNDKWKSEYLKELKFFKKEYIMLSSLFKQFEDYNGIQKWRPELLYIREDLFIFEDVGHLGYVMPNNCTTMTYNDLKVTIQALARFHASSYILEEKKSKEIGRPYRIWEAYSEHLQEPAKGQDWRDTGRNAIIDFLKVYSKYKNQPNLMKKAESVIPMLFDKAMHLMKPSNKYRNVVVHRDLWTNNILIKKTPNEHHALIVDFQTVLYASPMLDLTSVIYFNTSRSERDELSSDFFNIYYSSLSNVLQSFNMNLEEIFPKEDMMKSYNESIVFGITQAALIVPLASMSREKKEEIFCDPEKSEKANVVSRSEDFISIARVDKVYCNRVCELYDEIVKRYVKT